MKNKELEIIDYISQCDSQIPLDRLCHHFDLSSRSIRYYMENIAIEFPNAKVSLDMGIYTVGNMEVILDYLNDKRNIASSSTIKRKRLYYTFIFGGYVNLTRFANSLEISRVTVKQYFNEIEAHLETYGLKAHSDNSGITLVGDEESIRNIQLQTLLDHLNLSKAQMNTLEDLVEPYLLDVPNQAVDSFLRLIQDNLKSILSDYSYRIFRIYLMIVIRRLQKNQTVTTENHGYFLKECPEYDAISQHSPLIEKAFEIQLSQIELLRLTDLLIGSHYSSSGELKENQWFENNLLITKIISNFSRYIGINLNQDVHLYQSLMAHLKPTMYRILHNIKLMEIDAENISQRFPSEFAVTRKVLNELKFFTNYQEDKNEIALLTLHFKAAVNRFNSTNTKQIQVLIVCSHGYGTSKLLEQQLSEIYSVQILGCIPLHFLPFYEDTDSIELIITTLPNLKTKTDVPIIYVNPILSSEDFKRLDQSCLLKRKNQILLSHLTDVIQENCDIKDKAGLVRSLLEMYGNVLVNDLDSPNFNLVRFLPMENIRIVEEQVDWQTAVAMSGELLVKNGFVNEAYAKSMVESFGNYGSYMVIDDGIAIPHAKNEDNVFQTGIVLLLCRYPVPFTDEKTISAFFSFCSLDHHEHLDALVAISNLIRETPFKSICNAFKNEREVVSFIYEFASQDRFQ